YLQSTRGELKPVSWPTQKQTAYFTVVVIALSLFVSIFLGFFDFVFTSLLDTFII
ncbi:MAG: preprotein translocase subunit SecE, partial [bacterium]|nr:preprotein translocase subunit SecE [bacterium]